MALPPPVPGLVIRYSYLWHSEHLQGREEGRKDRPCAIIAAIRPDARVLLLPITHRPPDRPDLAVEVPAKVKLRLRLDDGRSWIILSEWNEFTWPGPDLRPAPGGGDYPIAYGMLPPGLFAIIRARFLAIIDSRAAKQVRRSE